MPRHSAAVYRRRRLATLIVGILFVAVIGVAVWLLMARPWASAAEATPSPSASAAESPKPQATDATAAESPAAESPSPDPSTEETPGIVACEAKDVEVAAVTDADSYDPGVLPQLSISLTNRGSTDCAIDVGSTTQRLTVSSGTDVWWTSTDCQENPSSMVATLTAGATVTSKVPVVWDRTRSSVETCAEENRPRAPGGGASYHVAVEIGGFKGTTTKQILLY
jgi:cytoskeletal protein RodZ